MSISIGFRKALVGIATALLLIVAAPGVASAVTWGSSYATNTETVQLRYTGKAKANANVWGNGKVTQVCFKYTRDGENQGGDWLCSKAVWGTYGPTAGTEVQRSIIDTLNPFAAKTLFRYSSVITSVF